MFGEGLHSLFPCALYRLRRHSHGCFDVGWLDLDAGLRPRVAEDAAVRRLSEPGDPCLGAEVVKTDFGDLLSLVQDLNQV
jgi:hypothetical protein